MMRLVLMLAAMFLFPTQAMTETDETDRMLKRIVIDNTLTFPGHEFYHAFTQHLTEMTGTVYFDHVVLRESRSQRSGNLIRIEHRQHLLFQTTVYPGDRFMEPKARQAAAVVSAKISKAQLNGLFSQEGDLADDEL